ncbi:hypothetical protein BGZ73_005635 [Actinomortierella ambigua]|nr:hypothetical protein BGZ73_005635 [Actinomortierella ambigua]
MFGDKKSVFRKVFKPRPDNIGLPLLGVKTLLKHLEVVDSPLSGSSAGGVEKQLLLWHGLRDGLALRREDLGEDCWLDTIKFLTDYTVVKHGPGDVVRAAHPGLHSLVVQVITDIPHLLSSFTDATAHALRKLSFVMDSTPLVELLPLLQRFRQLEELSIHTVPDDRHDDTFGLKSLDSEPEASDSATPMGATLPIKRLRVLSSDENSAFHSWLRVAIALCADTLEDLVVLELPHDVGDTERLEHPTWLSSNVSAEALWLNCKLPKLARLTFVSYDISYPFMYPPFNVRPAGADTGHHPTVGAENSSSTSSTSQEIMNPVVDMFPSLTSLSIIRCENQDRARFSSTAWKSLEPALGALRKLTTLRDLLVDLASLAQFHTLRPQEVLDCLPKGLRSFDFAASSPSSWSRMATEFEEGLRRAFLERQHDPLDVLVDSADDTHADSVQRTIPKIRTIAWPGLRTALLKDAFWLNHDIRNRFYR